MTEAVHEVKKTQTHPGTRISGSNRPGSSERGGTSTDEEVGGVWGDLGGGGFGVDTWSLHESATAESEDERERERKSKRGKCKKQKQEREIVSAWSWMLISTRDLHKYTWVNGKRIRCFVWGRLTIIIIKNPETMSQAGRKAVMRKNVKTNRRKKRCWKLTLTLSEWERSICVVTRVVPASPAPTEAGRWSYHSVPQLQAEAALLRVFLLLLQVLLV